MVTGVDAWPNASPQPVMPTSVSTRTKTMSTVSHDPIPLRTGFAAPCS